MIQDECKSKIEEAQTEKDKFNLKEQQLLGKISKLEEENKYDSRDREDKYTTLLDNLRNKHKLILDERESEISELNKNYTDTYSENQKIKNENFTLRSQINKLEKALQDNQHDVDRKCDDYQRQLSNVNESKDEIKRRLENENDILKAENENMRIDLNSKDNQIRDLQNKNNKSQDDYEKACDDNRHTKEMLKITREEKDSFELEASRIKQLYNTKMNELNSRLSKRDEDERLKHEAIENNKDKNYKVIKNLENLNDKWREEHKSTVAYFTKLVLHLNQENQLYKDANLDLRKELKRAGIQSKVPDKPSKQTRTSTRIK